MKTRWTILIAALTFVAGLTIGATLLAEDDEPTSASQAPQAATSSTSGDGQFVLEIDEGDVAKAGVTGEVIDDADLIGLVAWLNNELVLEDDISIIVKDDPDEAYYDEETGEIVLSPALIDGIYSDLTNLYESDEDAVVATASNLIFIALHEVGHAMTDSLELPITGREEVAADEFATVAMVTMLEDPIAALEASDLFDVMAQEPIEADFYDEHSLDQQRFFDLRCLVYGFAPDEFGDELEGLPIEEYRSDLCVADAERAAASWQQLLAPHRG